VRGRLYFFFFVAFFFAGAFFFAAIFNSPPILSLFTTIAHLLRVSSSLKIFLRHVTQKFKTKIKEPRFLLNDDSGIMGRFHETRERFLSY
jgi:hypothetical protein